MVTDQTRIDIPIGQIKETKLKSKLISKSCRVKILEMEQKNNIFYIIYGNNKSFNSGMSGMSTLTTTTTKLQKLKQMNHKM